MSNTTMQKKGLGKGLAALIHTPPARRMEAVNELTAPAPGEAVLRVAITSVVPSPLQPRKTIREEQLLELVDSIREHGVMQPLIVRKVDGQHELIAGERRWRACQRLELKEVPVIVRTASDRDVLELALIENLQREDLNPIEEADAYARLAKDFQLRQEDIAKRVGKNRATVANAMRLLELADSLKKLLINGQLTVGHAKALLSIKDTALQEAAADQVIRRGMNVRMAEKFVSSAVKNGSIPAEGSSLISGKAKNSQAAQLEIQKLEEQLREHLSTKVAINHGEKKGRIEIEYYGNVDLDRVLKQMGLSSRYDVL
jgi:ParB family transcriptional regulator, chromosome partitioning protein